MRFELAIKVSHLVIKLINRISGIICIDYINYRLSLDLGPAFECGRAQNGENV